MSEKEIEAFMDQLQAGESGDKLTGEEAEVASLWEQLGELKEPVGSDELHVAEFEDKLAQYRKGWEDASIAPPQSTPSRTWNESGFTQTLRYAAVAAVAALVGVGGYSAYSLKQRAERLEADLLVAQESLAVSLLEQPSASKRLAGLAAFSKMEAPSELARRSLIRVVGRDDNLNVRIAAVNAIGVLPREEALGTLLERMESEDSPIVQTEILRQILTLVGEGSGDGLSERVDGLNLEPRVKAFWDQNSRGI